MSELVLNVVIPLFNEQEIIEQLHQRVHAVCRSLEVEYEVIYVDDGSTDQTVPWLHNQVLEKASADRSPRGSTKLIQLSRNFGQPAAILAGLQSAQGDVVVLMDGDLQDPPELIPEMIQQWLDGNQVVIAQRSGRHESFFRGIGFAAFHSLFQYFSDSRIPPHTGTFCLLDRVAVNSICDLPEAHRFFPGLRAWVGYRQSMVTYERLERAAGEPKQTFSRLLGYAMDAMFSYSRKPLHLLMGAGAVTCLLSGLILCGLVLQWLLGSNVESILISAGASLMLGLGGMQLVGMGVLGEYIGRIYDEAKSRPPFIISQVKTDRPDDLNQPKIVIQQDEHASRKAG